jgi:D-glycero-beta-D-manno-heptose 1-phosphate adenylyltransferase
MNYLHYIESKILDAESLEKALTHWRFEGQKIVFTNGCFDLLHSGHLQYLAQAKNLGTKLVIGLNSDASTKRLKGAHRPINDEKSRSLMLAALIFVDAVVVFEEDTPLQLIEIVQPDVLVKGGDYSINTIVGAELVQQKGGLVTTLPFLEGYSTTNIEKKIKQNQHS